MKRNKKASDDNTHIRRDEIKTESTTQEKKKKPIFKRVWFWIIIVIIVLIIVAAALSGDDDSLTAEESSYVDTITVDVSPSDYDDALTFLADAIEDKDPNTSTMVDTIAAVGKKAANYWAGKLREEAISYLAETYPDYFADNKTMEYTMFYGYYLEYAYEDNGSDNTYANLGMDAYQAVKYIYRGTDTENSDHTQANLEQISEALEKLGYETETDL